MGDLDYLEPEDKEEEEPRAEFVNATIPDENKEQEKIDEERRQAAEYAKREQAQRIQYGIAADKVWDETNKLDLDKVDKEHILNLLKDGELDVATKEVQTQSTRQQQAKDLRTLEEGFIAGTITHEEYGKRMREMGREP